MYNFSNSASLSLATLSILKRFHNKYSFANCVSPLSLLITSAILNLGKNSYENSQIKEVTDEDLSIEDLINLNKIFETDQALSILNFVLLDENYKLCPKFDQQIKNISELLVIEFNENSINIINERINTLTKGLLNNVIEINENNQSIMNIINIINFNTEWDEPFLESDTQPSNFMTLRGITKSVNMMSKYEDNWYYEDYNIQLVLKSYKDNDYAMIFVLPKITCNFDIFNTSIIKNNHGEKIFDVLELENYIQRTDYFRIEMKLPKFELKFKTNEILPVSLSVQHTTESYDNTFKNVSVCLTHECTIQISEKNTIAATTNYAVPEEICLKPKTKGSALFNANKTFNCYVRKRSQKSIIFAGTFDA